MPLDIGIGLIIGVELQNATGYAMWICLLVGVCAALLPDIDYIVAMVRKNRLDSSHRDLLHYPLLLTPIAGLAGLLAGKEIAFAALAGVLAHFIHDSIGVGFGVKWLYPFNKKSYLFLYQARTSANRTLPWKLIYAWDDPERKRMIEKYGDPDWIRQIYFRLHPFGLFEYSFLIIGIVVLLQSVGVL